MFPFVEPTVNRLRPPPSSVIARVRPSSSRASPIGVPLPWILEEYCQPTHTYHSLWDLLSVSELLRGKPRYLPSFLDGFCLPTRRGDLISGLLKGSVRTHTRAHDSSIHGRAVILGSGVSLQDYSGYCIGGDRAVRAGVERVALSAGREDLPISCDIAASGLVVSIYACPVRGLRDLLEELNRNATHKGHVTATQSDSVEGL